MDGDAPSIQVPGQGGDETGRIQVGVLRIVEATGTLHLYAWLDPLQSVRIDHLHVQTERPHRLALGRGPFQADPGATEQQPPVLAEREPATVPGKQAIELRVQPASFQVHLPQQGRRPRHPFGPAGPAEVPQPPPERRLQARLDIERTLRVDQVTQSRPYHPGLGQRHAVTRYHHSGVAVGAGIDIPLPEVAAIDQGYRAASFGQEVGRADADGAAADHEDVGSGAGHAIAPSSGRAYCRRFVEAPATR